MSEPVEISYAKETTVAASVEISILKYGNCLVAKIKKLRYDTGRTDSKTNLLVGTDAVFDRSQDWPHDILITCGQFARPLLGSPIDMDPSKFIWMNGSMVPWADANVHVMSHALQYGTSIFEGMHLYRHQPVGQFFAWTLTSAEC